MHIRLADPSEAPVIAEVLSAAAANLVERGEALWSTTEISEPAVAPHTERGLYHIGFLDERAVGVFRLQTRDPVFWPEIPDGTSAYLHKLAVLPAEQGRGFAHELVVPVLSIHAASVAYERLGVG
jgi:GNAT superfamily N-acetyltransferase